MKYAVDMVSIEIQMQNTKISQSAFEPCCLATTIGSLPHIDVVRGTALMFENTPEIASWVQFPNGIGMKI